MPQFVHSHTNLNCKANIFISFGYIREWLSQDLCINFALYVPLRFIFQKNDRGGERKSIQCDVRSSIRQLSLKREAILEDFTLCNFSGDNSKSLHFLLFVLETVVTKYME